MKQIIMTIEQSKALIDAFSAALRPYGLETVLLISDLGKGDLRALGEIMRETVLKFEAKRLAANRKPCVAAPPKVEV